MRIFVGQLQCLWTRNIMTIIAEEYWTTRFNTRETIIEMCTLTIGAPKSVLEIQKRVPEIQKRVPEIQNTEVGDVAQIRLFSTGKSLVFRQGN